jgi:putative transposase
VTWSTAITVSPRPVVGNPTFVRTWQGFAYLAFMLDMHARMLVCWQMTTDMRSDLVVDALEVDVGLRQPARGGLVAHTDRSSSTHRFATPTGWRSTGSPRSAPVGSRGDAYDNAMAERGSRRTRPS